MNSKLIEKIMAVDIDVVIFDIDGTLKDLCKEHDIAIDETIKRLIKRDNFSVRIRIVKLINSTAMWIVKAGITPTNHYMQNFLITIFAKMLGINSNVFRKEYIKIYKQQLYMFDQMSELLDKISESKKIFFATVNRQNYNLHCNNIRQEQIMYARTSNKKELYRDIIANNSLKKEVVIIVGDNIVDDMLPARRLGIKHVLVNNYNSKLKSFIWGTLNFKCRGR